MNPHTKEQIEHVANAIIQYLPRGLPRGMMIDQRTAEERQLSEELDQLASTAGRLGHVGGSYLENVLKNWDNRPDTNTTSNKDREGS